jgi:hypothetical protein
MIAAKTIPSGTNIFGHWRQFFRFISVSKISSSITRSRVMHRVPQWWIQDCDRRKRSRHQVRRSTSFDTDFRGVTARLARQRELLESAAEQHWRDAGNDHFRSALGTNRGVFFERQLLASHMMSYHPTFVWSEINERSPVR